MKKLEIALLAAFAFPAVLCSAQTQALPEAELTDAKETISQPALCEDKAALDTVVEKLTEKYRPAEDEKISVIARIPSFFDFTPYLTSKTDVEEIFGKKARFFEDGPLGKRHIVAGDDFEMDVSSVLITYTSDERISDLYMRIPLEKYEAVGEKLRAMTAEMDPDGFWTRENGLEVWLTDDAKMTVQKVSESDFSVEYGALARTARETRAWLEADPEARCPHFSGLLIGWTTLEDMKKRVLQTKSCKVSEPMELPDGAITYTLTGNCFGIPGEEHSYLWFGADTGRLTRLLLSSKGDPEGFSSVLPALRKRYRETAVSGKFETTATPSRNVWAPEIRFDAKKGQLEFLVHTDGVKAERMRRDELLAEKKARQEQARRVDSLFD